MQLQRSYDEAGLTQQVPVVQDPQRPDVGGGDDVGGVDPHHGGRQVALAAAPALRGCRLVLGPQQAPPVPEETLLRIPVGSNLKRPVR